MFATYKLVIVWSRFSMTSLSCGCHVFLKSHILHPRFVLLNRLRGSE